MYSQYRKHFRKCWGGGIMFSNITKNCTPKTNCYVQNVLLAILKESDFSFSEVVAHIHKVCRKTQKINTRTPH